MGRKLDNELRMEIVEKIDGRELMLIDNKLKVLLTKNFF